MAAGRGSGLLLGGREGETQFRTTAAWRGDVLLRPENQTTLLAKMAQQPEGQGFCALAGFPLLMLQIFGNHRQSLS